MPVLQRTDLFLSQARTARSWQLVAFFLSIANVVLVGSFARLALGSRYVPYLVEVDRDGQVHQAGPLDPVALPEERLIEAQLRQFLWNLRVVVPDPSAQGELITRAYALASSSLRTKLDDHFAEPAHDPRRLALRGSRTVGAITLLRLPGTESTYQAQWSEVETERSALGQGRQRSFQGLLTVTTTRITQPEALAWNPLGLVITDFNWTETTPSER